MKLSFSRLLPIFIIVPFVELFILLRLADMTSPLTTFAIIIVTGVLGAYFAKQQGRLVIDAISRDINSGKAPAKSLVDGLCVLIGGILLLTPGILTDIVGFALVFPLTRFFFAQFILAKLSAMVKAGTVNVYTSNSGFSQFDGTESVDDDDIVVIDDESEK